MQDWETGIGRQLRRNEIMCCGMCGKPQPHHKHKRFGNRFFCDDHCYEEYLECKKEEENGQ